MGGDGAADAGDADADAGDAGEDTGDGSCGMAEGGVPGADVVLSSANFDAPIYFMVVRGDTIYFTSDGRVLSMPIAGGVPTVIASGPDFVDALVADEQSLYWATTSRSTTSAEGHGEILTTPLGGGEIAALARDQEATSLAVDDTRVYWTAGGRPPAVGVPPPAGVLLAIGKQPASGGTPTTLASGPWNPGSVATGAGVIVYARMTSTAEVTKVDSRIHRISIADGTDVELAATDQPIGSFAIDGATLFWIDGGSAVQLGPAQDGRIRAVPLAGGPATILLDQRRGPGSLVLLDADLYWAELGWYYHGLNSYAGAIWRMPKAGGTATTLVSGSPGIFTFAADTGHLAWIDSLGRCVPGWGLFVRAR